MVRVVFLHPDLGIGGAERLVVDAAIALRSRGCSVQIWTAHYDSQHCFSETLSPDLPVVCVGDWLPTSVFGYFHAVCAYLRMIYVALYLVFLSGEEYDVVFCDQVNFHSLCHCFFYSVHMELISSRALMDPLLLRLWSHCDI